MKNVLVIIACLFIGTFAFSQGEEVGPLMANPHLLKNKTHQLKANPNTFDSTFIFSSDTIDLPIFDEFSSSKFQTYNADFLDAGVTSDKVYRLLDMSNVKLDNDQLYTVQQTFRRTVNVTSGVITDDNFPPLQIRIGDLSSYPVTHIPTNVYPPFNIIDTVDYPNPSDTLWIPDAEIFQDSATQFFTTITNPELIWLDNEVYHNYSMALNPWSLGVATFDGLDEEGYPYAFGTSTTGYADHLTSKPIDMSTTSAADSIYLSFLYQPKGLGDQPESSDSLVLEFYAKDLDQWNRIWVAQGEVFAGFKQGHIAIKNSDYFKKGFQFRFKNYGGLSGSLDHFHLDYVNLRKFSGIQDTVIHDFAFVYPVLTLLETFTAVPWDHYKNNPVGKMSDKVKVVVRNSDNVPENNQHGNTSIYYSSVLEGSFLLHKDSLNNFDLNYSPWTTYTSLHDFSGGARFDETKPGMKEEFDFISTAAHLNTNFTQNDSTSSKQIFENYYSYDDGSAELAYGPTGTQARLAIKYTPYEADSLIGARIHFVPSVYDVSDKLFLLTVWADNGGVPGTVIYEDQLFFPRSPQYQYQRNMFTTYLFQDTLKVPVTGTFHIGWRQFDADRLNIGLDMNIVNNDKTHFSVDNGTSWQQSTFEGSVMIHPIFSTELDAFLGIKKKPRKELEIKVFPNPTTGQVKIEVEDNAFTSVEVLTIQGKRIIESDQPIIDISDFPSGMYFFKINGSAKSIKIIKQ
ncbi:MAG: T9SS type A sorting domain-containing protein [Crocinitomicaceae bacterium]